MADTDRTKEQIVRELKLLRRKVADLEARETAHKQVEEALRESERKLRGIFDSATDSIFITDLNNNITDINEAALRMFGYDSKEELVGHSLLMLVAERERDSVKERRQKRLGGAGVKIIEFRGLRKDGTEFFFEGHGGLFRDSSGNPLGFVSIHHDITVREIAEGTARLHNEIMRNMAEGVVLVRAKDSTIVYANPKFEEIFGYCTGELTGKNISIVNAPANKSPEEKAREITCHLKKNGIWQGEVNNIKKDGTLFWCYASVSSFTHKEYGDVWISIHTDITERKQAEEALQESEEFGTSLLENAPNPVLVINPDTSMRYINPAFEKLTGFSLEEIIGIQAPYPWWPEESRERNMANIQKFIRKGDTKFKSEQVIQSKKGERLWIELSSSSLVQNGELKYHVINWVDITERKQAEEKQQAILKTALDGFWITDLEGKLIEVNDSYCKMIGYSREELLNMSIGDIEAAESPAEITQHINTIREKGYDHFETRHRRKDGEIIDIEISVNYLDVKDGQLFVFARDITERKQAEKQLREAELKYRIVADNTYDWETWVSPEGNFIYSSPSCHRITGYEASEFMNNYGLLLTLIHPDDLAIVENHVHTADQGQPGTTIRYRLRHKDGSERWIEHTCQPVFDYAGKLLGSRGSNRDITERRRMEQTLQESEENFRSLVERANDGISIIQDKLVIYANLRQAEMWGGSVKEIVNTPFVNYLHADEIPRIFDIYKRRMAGEPVPTMYEVRLRRKDGSLAHAELNVGIVNYSGKPAELVITRDITERKKAEDLIKKANTEMESFINNIPDMAWLKDIDSNFIMVNKAFCDTVGIAPEYLKNHSCEVCFGAEVAGKFREDDRKVMEGRRQIVFEESIIDAGKNRILLETIKSPILDASGNVAGTVGIARDITGRKQMEEKLRQSEEFSTSLLENAPNPIEVVNPDLSTRYVNKAFEELTGFTSAEVVGGKPPYPWWPEESIKEFIAAIEKDLEKDFTEVIKKEIVFKNKKGERMWAEISIVPIKHDGVLAYQLVNWADITERKRAAEALRESEEMFRLLFNSVNDMIFMVEMTDEKRLPRISQVNDTACKKLGYSRSEMLDLHRNDITTPDAWQKMLSNISPRLLKAGSVTFESSLTAKDGHTITTEHNTRLLNWKGQQVALSVARDITRRKQAEEALRESEEKFSKIFKSSPNGIVISRPDEGIMIEVNSAWERLTGYSREEALGKDSVSLNLLSRQTYQNLISLFNQQGSLYEFELDIRRKSGDILRVSMSADEVEIRGEELRLITIRDITEHKLLEAERQRVEKLESIGTLAGGIAHDFNNLLTAIMGNISLAKRYIEPKGKAAERLEEAEKASIRARDLTQQLLTFSRGGAPVKKLVSIHKIIQDSASFALRGSGAKSKFSLPDDLWPLEIDEGQISQVLHNIIINADQAMPEGGTISIRAKNTVLKESSQVPLPKGRYLHIEIEDNGIGISQKHLLKIFEPYFTTKQKGSGLGLTTAYSIVKNHGGYITVESKQNVGTIFHIYLPASAKPSPTREEVKTEMGINGKGKVLVMDDEEIIREMLSNMLRLAGYEAELTSDGVEAIEKYQEAMKEGNPFSAVIMDLTIPGGMGGKEAVKKLLEIDPDAKVIVSSGYATDPIISEYKKYGFSAVVNKPYSVAEIEKALHDLLAKNK